MGDQGTGLVDPNPKPARLVTQHTGYVTDNSSEHMISSRLSGKDAFCIKGDKSTLLHVLMVFCRGNRLIDAMYQSSS